MYNLTQDGDPGHGYPIDQKGKNWTTKSKGIHRPDDQENSGNGCH